MIANLWRLSVIVAVLCGSVLARLPGLLAASLRRDVGRRNAIIGAAAAACAQRLGPVFIKIAQMASYRADLLPAAMLAPLSVLQDRVGPLASGEARRAVEASLGRSIGELFAAFDDNPLASGSVAVVCAATLHDGARVAVKIVRPGVGERIARDLACFRWVVTLAERSRRVRGIPLLDTFDLIARMVAAQVDMTAEREQLTQLRALLSNRPGVSVPAAHAWPASREVLVMERIDDAQSWTEAALPLAVFRRAADRMLNALYTMVFAGKIINCDLHPGNILVRADGSVTLLDAGLVARLEEHDRRCFRDFFLALAAGNAVQCARAIRNSASIVPPSLEPAAFQRDVDTLVSRYHGLRAGEFLVAQFVHEVFALQRRHGLFGAPGFAAAIWALVMFEGLVRDRYPELDFQSAARPFLVMAMLDGPNTDRRRASMS
ncbi:MAG: AarF/UbiB family protein [Xanthobacteraceae bacterium]